MKLSVCGKGGSGKSTLVTLLAQRAQARGQTVLVLDSDESNSGLFRMLGFEHPPSPLLELAGGKKNVQKKMKQPTLLNETRIRIEDIPDPYILSRNGLQLVSIGKIHQALEGCACPMGALCREFLKKILLKQNEIVIVDMEAGIEHFGRGIDTSIDTVVFVVDPSFESINLAEKVTQRLSDSPNKVRIVLNKIDSKRHAEKIEGELNKRGLMLLDTIPYDPEILEAGLEGDPLNPILAMSPIDNILDLILCEPNDHEYRIKNVSEHSLSQA